MNERAPSIVSPPLECGVIRLTGRDVLAVLHNVTTQSLLDLAPGEARLALWCDFRGRLIHRAAVARAADGAVWLVREDGGGASITATVAKSVFREDVRIEDFSASWRVAAEFGARSSATGHAIETDRRLARIEIPGCPTLVLSPATESADLRAAGAWAEARIEHGWAAHGHEVAEEFTPYDVNLGLGVHLDKGCYTGQESLMRMVTYGSLKRRLVRVSGEGAIPSGRELMDDSGPEGGVTTSAAATAGGWRALAVLKREIAVEGKGLRTAGGGRATVERVFALAQTSGRALPAG